MSQSFQPRGGAVFSPELVRELERLDQLVDWERRERAPGGTRAMRVDVGPMLDLAERLGSPQRAFAAVHVAGSKGKGSVASLIASGLARGGWRVGVYASPHVEHVHERIRLHAGWIDDARLARALARALDARDRALAQGSPGSGATFFDVFTAAAFLAFAEANLDLAVVECGLGGRLDSTNVIDAPLCVITNIELEHTAILGSTRAAIAFEKAGIVHRGATCVSAVGGPDDEAQEVIARATLEAGGRLVAVERDLGATMEQQNVALAGRALDELGRLAADGKLRGAARLLARREPRAGLLDSAAIAAARLPGRLERGALDGRAWVLDGAHTPGSLAALLRDLEQQADLAGRPVVVLGMGREKDAEGMLKVLGGRVDRVVCTSPGTGPYRTEQEVACAAERVGLVAETATSPQAALERALRHVPPGGWGLVTGSLHLVGALRQRIVRSQDPCSPSSRTCS